MNELTKLPATKIDSDDIGHNTSNNTSFDSVLTARLNRRDFLLGSLSTGAMAIFGGVSMSALAGCGAGAASSATEMLLGFKAVSKSLADIVSVPEGYSYSVLFALGDPLAASVSAYGNLGNDSDYEQRFGDHHDGWSISACPLTAHLTPPATAVH